MRAKNNKGWFPKGDGHPNAKLTSEDVVEIRKLYFKDGLTQQKIADKYNIRQSTVGKIVCGIRWTCV